MNPLYAVVALFVLAWAGLPRLMRWHTRRKAERLCRDSVSKNELAVICSTKRKRTPRKGTKRARARSMAVA